MAVKVNIITGYNGRGATSAIRDLERMQKAADVAGRGVTSGMFKAAAGMERVGSKMSTIGAAATAKLTLPLVAAGTYAFNTAAEFETSMNQVAAATNAPAAQMEKLTALAKKMGADTIYSANEAGQAMLELAKAGMSPAQIQAGGLEATMRLAAAGGIDLASAATTTSNALNMFGLAADKADQVANALAGGANASSASVDSLQQALSQVGPGARNAGLSLNDTVGVLAAFADKGIQGSDAGTSLKTMLSRLVPQTDEQAKAMERLGLSFVDSQGNFDDIGTVAQKLQDKLGGLSEAERSAALQTLFGSDATRAATVLMQEGESGIQKYIAATKDQTAAQAMADARMGGAAGAMERMKGSIETAALSLGQALVPTVTQVAGVIEKLSNAFSGLSPKTQDLIVKIGLAAAAFGPVMFVVGKVTSTVGKVTGGVAKLTLAFGDGAEAAPKWARAMAGGVKGAVSLAKSIASAVVEFGKQAIAWTVDTARKVANTAATWASIAAQKAAAIGAKLWAAAQWLLNAAMTANPIGLVVAAIVALIAIFVIAWNRSEKFREIVTKAWEGIKAAAGALWDWLKTAFNGIVAVWQKVKDGAVAIFNGIVAFFRKWGPWMLAALLGPIGLVAKLIIDNWSKIKSGTTAAFGAVLNFIKSVPGKILGFFAGVGSWLLDAGRQLIAGLKNGIVGAWESFKSWFTDLIGQPVQWAKNILGIHSPSTVFRDIGRQTGQGLALGLQDKNGRVTEAGKALANATIAGMTDLPDKVRAIANGTRSAEISMLESKQRVADAERELKDAVAEHGKKSDEARLATLRLAEAREEAKGKEGDYKKSVADSKQQIVEFTKKANGLLERRYGEATYRAGQDAAQGLAHGLTAGEAAVRKSMTALVADGVVKPARTTLETHSPSKVFKRIGGDTANGLWEGLKEKKDWLYAKVMGWVKSVLPAPVKKALGINSPSKVFARIGENLAEGLAMGMRASTGLVANAALGLARSAAIPAIAGGGAGPNLSGVGTLGGTRAAQISVGGIRIEVSINGSASADEARTLGAAAGEEAARAFLSKIAREKRRG